MERLPLLATVTEAVQRYRERFFALLRVIVLPALAYVGMSYLWYQWPSANNLPRPLLLLAQAFPLTLAALSCHRVLLLGPESVPSFGTSGTVARDWRFVGMAAVLFVITNILLQVPVTATFLFLQLDDPGLRSMEHDTIFAIGRFAALPAIYVACRYSLCLPAIAVDRPLRMRQAWALTRGYGMRLLLLIGVSPWLLHFVQRSLADLLASDTDYVVASNFMFWLLLPLEIALLSICFRRLSQTAT